MYKEKISGSFVFDYYCTKRRPYDIFSKSRLDI